VTFWVGVAWVGTGVAVGFCVAVGAGVGVALVLGFGVMVGELVGDGVCVGAGVGVETGEVCTSAAVDLPEVMPKLSVTVAVTE
jgi:hypothetical protein